MKFIPSLFLILIAFHCITCKSGDLRVYTPVKSAQYEKGMIVSAHPLASDIGIDILKKGGNAVDAAIAVHYALAVVLPTAGNIGGGGFMVVRMADGSTATLDFREMAPEKSYRDMYLDEQGEVIPRLSIDGHLAAGVPGSVAGMEAAFKKYSKLKNFDALIDPAIALAKDGFSISRQQASSLNNKRAEFLDLNDHPTAFTKKNPWKAGDILLQKDLAQTLMAIKEQGKAGFYEGKVAQLIVAEMNKKNGIISLADLKNYKAVWRKPLISKYKEYTLYSMPPPSSGGIALSQMLKMIAPYPLAKMGYQSSAAIHLMTEVERRAYADRAIYLGDPDFINVPVKELLANDYLQERMESFDPSRASSSSEIQAGSIEVTESEETTHFSIVDQYGNAVSLTTTINGAYGSRTVVEGAGFILNNEMDDFSAKPGVPNMFGLIGNEANAIAPRKRMLSSMTPTIITKEDSVYMVVGTPGGSTIITSVFQTFLNVAEFGLPLKEAVSDGRFHHQWKPDVIYLDQKIDLSEATQKDLENKGHTLQKRSNWGRVDAILRTSNAKWEGAADIRGDDDVKGF